MLLRKHCQLMREIREAAYAFMAVAETTSDDLFTDAASGSSGGTPAEIERTIARMWEVSSPDGILFEVVTVWRDQLAVPVLALKAAQQQLALLTAARTMLKALADCLLLCAELPLAVEMYTACLLLSFNDVRILCIVLDLCIQLNCITYARNLLTRYADRCTPTGPRGPPQAQTLIDLYAIAVSCFEAETVREFTCNLHA
jgi:hypothetical protein